MADSFVMSLFSSKVVNVCFLFFLPFFAGLVGAFWERRKFLLSLLSLEFSVLGLFGGLIFLVWNLDGFIFIGLLFLVMGACEASLGLSVLVVMTRLSGSDALKQISSLKC